MITLESDACVPRSVGVNEIAAGHPGVAKLGSVISVVAAIRVARRIARRILPSRGKAAEVRAVVPKAVAGARIEAALGLVQRSLRPQRGRRQDRGGQRRCITEDRVQVVLRHQEPAYGELAPASLQANKRFAAAQITGVGVAIDRRLDLEDGVQPTAQAFGAPHPKARRVAAQPVDRGIRSAFGSEADVAASGRPRRAGNGSCCRCARFALDEFEVDIQAAIKRDVRGLRLRCQRQRKCAGDGKSDELFIHESFSSDGKKWQGRYVAPAIGTFSGGSEKLVLILPKR